MALARCPDSLVDVIALVLSSASRSPLPLVTHKVVTEQP